MKYIKYFKESSKYDELKEKVELYIVDLIDNGFTVECDADTSTFTYDHISVIIESPYSDYKPYDEQDKFYWNEIKDNIIVLTKLLQSDYYVSEVSIKLWDGEPYIIESDDFEKLDNVKDLFKDNDYPEHIDDMEVSRIVLYLIKNK
jgi:hypothetical protein